MVDCDQETAFSCHQAVPGCLGRSCFYSLPTTLQQFIRVFPCYFSIKTISLVFYLDLVFFDVDYFCENGVSDGDCSEEGDGLWGGEVGVEGET